VCLGGLERINDLLRYRDLYQKQDVARLKDIRGKLRRDLQVIRQETRQKKIAAKERKTGEDMLRSEYQLLSADRRTTDIMMDLLAKERLENQRLMDSLEAETRRREEQKLTRLQEKERERGRSPVQREHHQQAAPIIMNVSPNRKPFISVQPPKLETQREQAARRERERQRLDEENKQREREKRERKERDREREDHELRRRYKEKVESKQRERERKDNEKRRREQERANALANKLARKSVPDLRALKEVAREENTMFPAELMPPAKVEAVQTPAGSPKIPAEAGPTALLVKKSKTSLKKEIRFIVPPGGKAESVAESSNTTPTAKKLQKRSMEDLRKHVNRTEDDDKKMNDAHFVAMRLASEVRKYEPEERKDCSEMPKIKPLETKYGQAKSE
jgi:hypothetical protein